MTRYNFILARMNTHAYIHVPRAPRSLRKVDYHELRRSKRLHLYIDQTCMDRWKRSHEEVKSGDIGKIPLHPVAKIEYMRFLQIDLN